MQNDILVELTRDEVFELKQIYGKVRDAFYVHTLMDVAIRFWDNKGLLTVTSPGDAWKDDGSIVVFSQRNATAIFPFSLDKTYSKISEALSKTKRIDPDAKLKFSNILENYIDPILSTVHELDRIVVGIDENSFYAIPIEEAKGFDTECLPGTYVKKLDKSHAFRVNEVWPHRYENSEETIAYLIEKNVGFGLFLKESDCLVSWILQGHLGHMNALQTRDEYKGRGYGKLMLKIMSKHLAEKGIVPVATVLKNNIASNWLFQGIGFKEVEKSYFLVTEVKKKLER